jgi:hypothetical protein
MRITEHKGVLGIVLIGAIAAGVIAAMMAASSGAKTWTIEPGGVSTGKAENIVLTDTTSGLSVFCASSTTTIDLKSGGGLANPIGRITSVTFSKCMAPGGVPLTATASATQANPWHLIGISYANGVNEGTMTNLAATISGPGCSATMAGSTASSPGHTIGHYYNRRGQLQVISGNLHIWNVKGCHGLLHSGDAVSMHAPYTFSPRQTITIP